MWITIKKIFKKTEDPSITRTLKKQNASESILKTHERFSRYGILLLALAIITYFLPSPNPFNFIYMEGEPWHYAPLYSSYKFNINMSDSVLQMKQDSVKNDFEPYFELNPTVKDSVLFKIKESSSSLVTSNPRYQSVKIAQYVHNLNAQVDSIYKKGVVSQTSYDSLLVAGTSYIRIVDNNKASQTSMTDIYCLESAYKELMNPVITESFKTDTLRQQFLSALNLNTLIKENLSFDAVKSDIELQAMIDSVSPNIGFVMENEKIIDRGEIITKDKIVKLNSYQKIVSEKNAKERPISMILGQILMAMAILLILNSYLYIFRRDYCKNIKAYIMLFSMLVFFCALASTLVEHHLLHVFILPFCIVPITIRVFLDSRTAFVFHIGMVMLVSISLNNPYEFMLIEIIGGMVAVQSLRDMTQRSQIVMTMIAITIVMEIVHQAYEMMSVNDFSWNTVERYPFYFILIGGVLLLLAYPLFWLVEKFFGFTSEMTLVELSNTNYPLLKKLTEEAPGTFHHSMQVATLASEIASKIDANVQLVRTGALYHDIGKLSRPVFFTENQSDKNPHDRISPVQSARAIIEHVTNGIKLAEHYNLPEVIKRFITTHHGSGKVKYFYITYKNEHPDEEIDETLFTYPGPNPETKEEAILMMADSVEAASRSLDEYTEESISNLVDKIVDGQMSDGFYNNCDITFKDIQIAKNALKERLKTVYHTRISYPELLNEDKSVEMKPSEKAKKKMIDIKKKFK